MPMGAKERRNLAVLLNGLRNRSENFIRIGAVSLDRQSPAASGNDAIRKLRSRCRLLSQGARHNATRQILDTPASNERR
jgi:hypothetical protein